MSMWESLPAPLREGITGLGVVVGASYIGRLMHHARQVEQGHRKFFSAHLVWEMPVAIGMGFVAKGIIAYYGVTDSNVTLALIIGSSYLGPGLIETAFWRILDRFLPKTK